MSDTSAAVGLTEYCGHCGYYHQGTCPRIKVIEYWPTGAIKRVEYHEAKLVMTNAIAGEAGQRGVFSK